MSGGAAAGGATRPPKPPWLAAVEGGPGRLLAPLFGVAVPMWIARYKLRGGPTPDDWRRVTAKFDATLFRADVLLRGCETEGVAADVFNDLAESVAVAAFTECGIRFFGVHYHVPPAPAAAAEGGGR